jgi:enediyne polyketide synthase
MEKRSTKRISVNRKATFNRNGFSCKCFLISISEDGLQLIVSQGQGLNARHRHQSFTLLLPVSSSQTIEISCDEIWSDGDIMGVQIKDPSADYKAFYRQAYFKIKKEISHDSIAVIGMGCHYPGSPSLKALWENILARRREFRRLPDRRLPLADYYDADPAVPDKTYGDRAAVIDGFVFDWIKRGIPKSVVESSDIVHWLALEVAIRALEDAGYSHQKKPCDRTGVILGNTLTGEFSRSQNMRLRWPYVSKIVKAAAAKEGLSPHLTKDLLQTMEGYYKSAFAPVTEDTLAGNLSNTIAGRICNFLDLHGGGYTVDGACSSSLIAVATAASALSNGTLDLALAGGIDISLDTFELVGFSKTKALTRGDMRVYDKKASGFIPGEGAGFVVLKRLQDARKHGNYVYAVLRGWAISSDGKGGMTAPKAEAQALAIKRAYGKAGYAPSSVDFIEGHGTGTAAGDRAEVEGVAMAMVDPDRPPGQLRSCGMTSLKSLIGHTKAASGIGGFIKAVMAVNRRVIPPTAGCSDPNAVFQERAKTLFPVMHGEVHDASKTMRAGISGMGFGGINCHLTVESDGPPASALETSIGERELLASYQETEIFVISAQDRRDMAEKINVLKKLAHGISPAELTDLSHSLTQDINSNGRLRAAVIASSPDGLIDRLDSALLMLDENEIAEGTVKASPQQDVWVGSSPKTPRTGFLFPGQGSQQLGMGKTLIERYAWASDLSAGIDPYLAGHGYKKIVESIYPPVDRAIDAGQVKAWKKTLSETEIAQPSICLASILWMRRLERLGIVPYAAGGHSLGELTAFHAAGAFSDQELILFAAFRGAITAAKPGEAGAMASLACDRKKAQEILDMTGGYAIIANMNSPMQTIISGEGKAIEEAMDHAASQGIVTKLLPVSNAFHSCFMDSAASILAKDAPVKETLNTAKVRLFTSTDGSPVPSGTDIRRHFSRQLTHTVDFISLVKNMAEDCDVLIEVGPGRVLSDLANAITAGAKTPCLPVEAKGGDDRSLNTVIACYYVNGGAIKWPALFENRLVRPFLPISERVFIENPCERPDLPMNGEVNRSIEAVEPGRSKHTSTRETEIAHGRADSGLAATPIGLLTLASEMTGFPIESISLDHRLLDDMNLDSIKAGQFVAKAIKLYGAEGKIDPTASANSSLKEIYDRIRPEQTEIAPGIAGSGLAETPRGLLALASEMTGFPIESISLDHRLLDDMNLDSIKAGQFVAKAIKLYGAEGKIDPTASANSSLREIYDRIKPEQRKASPTQPQPKDAWVRDFTVNYVPRPLTLSVTDNLRQKKILIVSDEPLSGLDGITGQSGLNATVIDYASVPLDSGLKEYDYFIFLLPGGQGPKGLLAAGQVREMAGRLHRIAATIALMKTRARKPACAVVQHGGTDFYRLDSAASIGAKGAAAFLSSLHQENPDERIRVLQFSGSDPLSWMEKTIDELQTPDTFVSAVYDGNLVRHVPVLTPIAPQRFTPRPVTWTDRDVVLVTGGARGITAACALAFARKTGVVLAIVGSTANTKDDPEIWGNLGRYGENNIQHRYYACDVTDKNAVDSLVGRIEEELGPITGFLHGAALNRPRRAEQVEFEAACREISPKVLGAINILEAIDGGRLKLAIALGSIIGVTGMVGNAWYGFSNEVLNLLFQQFKGLNPAAEIITCAFSVWAEVGMGAKMGSIETLSRMGIHAIPEEKGIEHFMRLAVSTAGEPQIVVAGRLGSIPTMRSPLDAKRGRFTEEVLFFEQGVEIESRAVLTPGRDRYLEDHVFRGTRLFPTVFGIEAMQQAVMAVMKMDEPRAIEMEDVNLSYPITVEPGGQTEIRIRALVQEPASEGAPTKVKASITVDQTAFGKNHFEATFVLGGVRAPERYTAEIPETGVDIDPREDLYGHMLFQGPSFQRIGRVMFMSDDSCVFETSIQSPDPELDRTHGLFAAGDPYFRDTLLQSVQIILPNLIALPVGIRKWEIFGRMQGPGKYTAIVDIRKRNSDVIVSDVTVVGQDGEVVEKIYGYTAKIIETIQDAPTLNDLLSPDYWDGKRVNQRVRDLCEETDTAPFEMTLKHIPDLSGMTRPERHSIERTLFRNAFQAISPMPSGLPEEIVVDWTEQGKPFLPENGEIALSCSHDSKLLVCSAGTSPQGCDVEPVVHRDPKEWALMLGREKRPLLEILTKNGDSYDLAATRLWCAVEALRKATDMRQSGLTYSSSTGDSAIFTGEEGMTVFTFPITLLRGRTRVIAVAAQNFSRPQTDGVKPALPPAGPSAELSDSGPEGQRVFSCRFPLGLRDNSTVSGGVNFATYANWLGNVREAALKPIGKYITDEFYSGHFMVTNLTETRIFRHVRNHETIEARAWVDRISGYKDSSLTLKFEWRKVTSDGAVIPVAFSSHQVSWIKVVGHGVVEPVECPPFFASFLSENNFAPPGRAGKEATHTPPIEATASQDFGALIHAYDLIGSNRRVAGETTFETTTLNSNLAQNIYFSNYFTWQGHIIDKYLFGLDPRMFMSMSTDAQFATARSHVTHLREAMPFDRIVVTMQIENVWQRAVDLYFEYFRLGPGDERVKLAYGHHTLVWASTDQTDKYMPQDIPDAFMKKLV